MTFIKGHPYGKRIKEGERLSPMTEFKKGHISWNTGKAKQCVCVHCQQEFRNMSHGKPKYCTNCLGEAKKMIAKENAKKNIGRKISIDERKMRSDIAKKLGTWRVLFRPEVREKAITASKKRLTGKPSWNRGGKAPWATGENNVNWKGGITTESKRQRTKFRETIQKEVLNRDGYACQMCGSKKNLQVDHIQSWAEYVELRFCIDNCRTLCAGCHYEVTYEKPMPDENMAWGHNFKNYSQIKGGN